MFKIRRRWKQTVIHASCFLLLSAALGACGVPQNNPATVETRPERRPLPERNIERTTTGRYDLERDEQRGGHTLQRHVGRTDAQLQERLQRERNISAASTWTDQEIAEETVAQALSAERSKLDRWFSRGYPRPNLALHFHTNRVIGRSLRRGENTSVPCSDAVIVLRADGPSGFYVLTTYPEDRE